MKKILKWLGIGFGSIILLVVIASIAIMFIVDEKMIEEQMESALNRQVVIGDISVGIFSVLSGIEVNDVQISNFKTPKQLEALKEKPVRKRDLFVGMKSFQFKIKFMPLLSGEFQLTSLVLNEPVINVVKYKNEKFNFSDLLTPSKKAEPEEEEKTEEVKEVETTKEAPGGPFTADNLPIAITIGKIGIENGQLSYDDRKLGQKFQVYDLTTLIHSIDIDPDDLENSDYVGLDVKMGVKTVGQVKSGSVKSFDIGFDIEGDIIPFDKKTRIANPEIILKAGLPYGQMTGLQIFENMKSTESLTEYCGKLNFLKKDMKWKDAYVDVWYKDGTVKLTNGKIPTEDYVLTYEGSHNLNNKKLNMNMDMLLADKHQKSIRAGINGKVKMGITGNMKKYVKPDKVTDIAMKRMVNEDGKVFLKYKVTGKIHDPNTKLVHPKLPSIKDLIKESAGDIKDVAMDQAKDKGKEIAQKKADEKKKKAEKKAKKKAAKKLKKLF